MRRSLLALSLALSFGVCAAHAGGARNARHTPKHSPAAGQRPPALDCSTATDADIVNAIYAKLEADPWFKNQLRRINVSVKDRVVKLEGRVTGLGAINRVINYARRTPCVKDVVSKLYSRRKVGCGPAQKPCGDICIDQDSECTIRGKVE